MKHQILGLSILALGFSTVVQAATLNVRDYGATGNGGSDDTGAIQRAISSSAAGDTVYFPNGTYVTASHITFAGGRTYQGQSASAMIKRSGAGDNAARFGDGGAANNSTVDTLTFDTGGLYIGSYSNRVTVRNSRFQNIHNCGQPSLEAGVWMSDFTQNITLTGNTFYSSDDCGSYNISSDNYTQAGVFIYNPTGPTTITNNVFDTLYQGISVHITQQGSFSNLSINSNEFKNIHRMGIEAQGNTYPAPGVSNVQINNNYFHNYHQSFWNSFGVSLVIAGKNQEMKGNIVDNTSSTECAANGCADGLEFGEGVAVISGNTIKSYFGDGIAIGSRTSGTLITGNILCGSATDQRIAYENQGDSGSTITGNTLLGTCPAGSAPPVQTPAPTITSFTASPATITAGGASTLSWGSTNATSGSIDHGVGNVNGESVSVSPSVTTTYTLTAVGPGGSVTKSVTVTVNAAVAAPTITSFTASPATITAGASTTLSWGSTNATSGSIDHGVGNINGTSVSVSPSVTTTFTLTAVGPGGTVTKAVTVTVNAAALPLPSITSFSASPSSITPGANTTLSWAVTGASSLSISPSVGSVSGNSVSVNPSASTTYTLSATNASGTVLRTVDVTVSGVAASAPAAATNLSGNSLSQTSATLVWKDNSTNETGFLVERKATNGSDSFAVLASVPANTTTFTDTTGNPFWQYTYEIVATNGGSNAAASNTVVIQIGVASIPATPTALSSNAGNGTVTLSWGGSSGASTYNVKRSLTNGSGYAVVGQSSSGSYTDNSVVNGQTYYYVVTASNASGESGVSNQSVATPSVPKPTIGSFSASPSALTAGGSTTLSWQTSNATAVSINQGVGTVTGQTSIIVSPTVTTTYTLTAANSGGSVSQAVTVSINSIPLAASTLFADSFSPTSVVLTWTDNSSNETGFIVERRATNGTDAFVPVTTVGANVRSFTDTSNVQPYWEYSYEIIATNGSGNSAASNLANVQAGVRTAPGTPQTPPVTVSPTITSFTVNPTSIQSGASATLQWVTANATALSISPTVGTVTGQTSVSVKPSATTTYTLTATGNGTSVTKTVTLSVMSNVNLIQDPGFENQGAQNSKIIAPWIMSGSAMSGIDDSNGAQHSGKKEAWLYSTGAGSWSVLQQTVTVAPNTVYTLSTWFVGNLTNGGIGVSSSAGLLKQVVTPVTSAYQQETLTFNSGSATSLVVWVGYVPGAVMGYFRTDDWSLTQGGVVSASAVSPLPVPTLKVSDGVNANVSYPSGYSVANYEWMVSSLGSSAESIQARNNGSLHTAAAETGSASLSLSSLNLSQGVYQIQVAAIMADGSVSPWAAASMELHNGVSASAGSGTVYPNPWRKDKHNGHPVTIDGLTSGSTVKLFTLSGAYITTLQVTGSKATWDPMGGDGAASGIYLYTVEDPQRNTSKGKFVVIR